MHKRHFLLASAALGAGALLPRRDAAAVDAGSPGQPFDHAGLQRHARALAARPFQAAPAALPPAVAGLDWDRYQAIRFRREHALWADRGNRLRLRFFHLGLMHREPVRLFEVADGRARELAYDPAAFDFANARLDAATLPPDLGYAGFRLHVHSNPEPDSDVAAFLGASYFRAVGAELQYGLSARGLAVDCGLPRAEEFPRFTAFWLERPARNADHLVVHALLDSPSITGACRFDIRPGSVLTMEVEATLYPRQAIERLGIAPLTSMYQTGENDRRMATDWRPEIHDSDGLALHNGRGEWLWRPLANPPQLRFNAYQDEGPRGFGLMQRDRAFDHYQDDAAYYDRRPDLWVEPLGDWGKGAVDLVEIPTPDETHDNIVAFWHPAAAVAGGQELHYRYRLHWGSRTPAQPPLARVVATRSGLGGTIGQPRRYFSWRFAVDFVGGELARPGRTIELEALVHTSRGQIEHAHARPLAAIGGYRAVFDLRPDDGAAPADLRLQLAAGGRIVSETWSYQWWPPEPRAGVPPAGSPGGMQWHA